WRKRAGFPYDSTPMAQLKEGTKAPAFTLPDQDGNPVSLKDFKGKTVVLYFYPKDMTPGCTQEACDFRDANGALTRKGAVELGVSKDSPARHRKFIEKQKLNFTLLADEDGEVCESYGVWRKKKFMGREFMGIVRATFLIGPDGKIQKIWDPVSVKGHVE